MEASGGVAEGEEGVAVDTAKETEETIQAMRITAIRIRMCP